MSSDRCVQNAIQLKDESISASALFASAGGPDPAHPAGDTGNLVIGYYDASTPPALRIHSGDIVEIHTLGVGTPTALANAGMSQDKIEPALLAVLKAKPNGRGHFLTGPVFVEGAEPGDVLEVQIRSINLAVDYAYNGMGSNGTLFDEFPQGGRKIIPLDRTRMVAPFAPGVEVPLHPFFGSMGLAPAPSAGRVSSTPPGMHAGNLDNHELVAGTKLFIPVQAAGALFQVGDGHAAQGDERSIRRASKHLWWANFASCCART